MSYITQIVQLPPGSMSEVIQIRNLFAVKYVHHAVGIGHLSNACTGREVSFATLT